MSRKKYAAEANRKCHAQQNAGAQSHGKTA